MASEIVLYMPEPSSVRLIECSPPSWMVWLALKEKGLPHQVVTLSFAKGEHKTPEMLARNPRGTIPVLCDGAFSLFETYAILEYLEYAYPTPSLMPEDRAAHVQAILRLHESSNLKAAGMALFAYLMRTPEAEHDADAIASMGQTLCKELGFWEGYYSGAHPWAAGDALSLADLSVFTYVATSVHLGLTLQPSFPALAAFVERMKARPSALATWPLRWELHNFTFLQHISAA